jgi:hypothetical protein
MCSSIAGFHAEGEGAFVEAVEAFEEGAGPFMPLKKAPDRLAFRPGLLAGRKRPGAPSGRPLGTTFLFLSLGRETSTLNRPRTSGLRASAPKLYLRPAQRYNRMSTEPT